jgi:hypothetical protein
LFSSHRLLPPDQISHILLLLRAVGLGRSPAIADLLRRSLPSTGWIGDLEVLADLPPEETTTSATGLGLDLTLIEEMNSGVGKRSVAVMKNGVAKMRIGAVKRSDDMQIKSASDSRSAGGKMNAGVWMKSVNAKQPVSRRGLHASELLLRNLAKMKNCVLEIDGHIARRWFLVPPPTSTLLDLPK